MRGKILTRAIDIINAVNSLIGERQDRYGNPEDSFRLIASLWNVYLDTDQIQPRDVAMMMVLFKLARQRHQHNDDNLIDAAGYLGLAGDMENE